MAAGVPETDVFQAADAVLARGERPTVERVRTELGRGSPARVGQLLDQWWEQLAQRLKGHALLPELPGEVAQTFAEAWRLALAHADTTAQVALREEHIRLFAEQTSLTQERKLWEIALSEARANAAEAGAQFTQSIAQLHERQLLIDQLGTQVADLQHQRDHLQRELDRRQAELDTLRVEHAAVQAHIRTAEDRAHQQVDRARQEVKALELQRERAQRETANQIAALTAQRDALHTSVRTAEKAAAHQTGRVAALEATIAKWKSTQAPAAGTARKASKKTRVKQSTPNRPAAKRKLDH